MSWRCCQGFINNRPPERNFRDSVSGEGFDGSAGPKWSWARRRRSYYNNILYRPRVITILLHGSFLYTAVYYTAVYANNYYYYRTQYRGPLRFFFFHIIVLIANTFRLELDAPAGSNCSARDRVSIYHTSHRLTYYDISLAVSAYYSTSSIIFDYVIAFLSDRRRSPLVLDVSGNMCETSQHSGVGTYYADTRL